MRRNFKVDYLSFRRFLASEIFLQKGAPELASMVNIMFKSILKKLREYYATVMDCTLLLTGVFGGIAIMAFDSKNNETGLTALLFEIGMLGFYIYEVKHYRDIKKRESSKDEVKTNDEISPEYAVVEDKEDYTHAYDKYAGLYEHLNIAELNVATHDLEETYGLLASILDSDHYYRIENGITMAVCTAGYSKYSVAYVTKGKLHAGYWDTKPGTEAHLLDAELDKVFESVLDEARINLRVMRTIMLSKIKDSVKLATIHDTPANVDIEPIVNTIPYDDSATYTTVQVVYYPYATFMRSE